MRNDAGISSAFGLTEACPAGASKVPHREVLSFGSLPPRLHRRMPLRSWDRSWPLSFLVTAGRRDMQDTRTLCQTEQLDGGGGVIKGLPPQVAACGGKSTIAAGSLAVPARVVFGPGATGQPPYPGTWCLTSPITAPRTSKGLAADGHESPPEAPYTTQGRVECSWIRGSFCSQ